MDGKTLFLIPARGGSKGIPEKNVKELAGEPLIAYSIEYARRFSEDEHIYLSTDDVGIAGCAEALGLEVGPFRPSELAQDDTPMSQVVHHSLQVAKSRGHEYEFLCLLQPTSPLRYKRSMDAAFLAMTEDTELVIGVKEVESNPFYLLYEEDKDGRLSKALPGEFANRQSAPKLYELNGAMYLFRVKALESHSWINSFDSIKKVLMDPLESIDLDTPMDWAFCEFLIEHHWDPQR